MPTQIVKDILSRLSVVEKKMNNHFIESGSIKAHLKWNTVITTVILTAVIGRMFVEFFKK